MDVQIKLDQFEGPLDLLLHLVEKAEVDISQISIVEITDQYMRILSESESLELEIASEFLVMAATLVAIKSRMLLPQPKKQDTSDGQADEEWLDPREQLVERLLEYKKFKRLGEMLGERENKWQQYYRRSPMDLTPYTKTKNPVEGITPDDLLEVFVSFLKKEKEMPLTSVAYEEVTVEDRIREIERELEQNHYLTFQQLLPSTNNSKEWVITTFLALLELIKLKKIICHQEDVFSEIWIEKVEKVLMHG